MRNSFSKLAARKPLFGALAVGLVMSVPSWALTAPALKVTAGGTTLTIDGTGTATFNPPCPSCASSVNAPSGSGSIKWVGTIGNLGFLLIAHTKPFIGSAGSPQLDLSTNVMNNGGSSATVTISWSDVGFTSVGPLTLAEGSNFSSSGGTVTYTAYADSGNGGNNLFGTGTLIATTGPTTGPAVIVGASPSGEPFSMTSVQAITLAAGESLLSDIQFTGTATNTCTVPYPYGTAPALTSVVFNESGVLEAFATGPATATTPMQIRAWFSDEHAPLLGARAVEIISPSGATSTINYPFNSYVPSTMGIYSATSPLAVGDTALTTSLGGTSVSYAGVDTALQSSAYNFGKVVVNGNTISGRPLWPALFLTDLTVNGPGSTAGDWQMGNTNGIPPNGIYGIWKGAVVVVDESQVPPVMSVTTDADPAPNNNGNGNPPGIPDPPPGGYGQVQNLGYFTEATWNANDLGMAPGHLYRIQVMVHDGDQNHSGGDVGEGCLTNVTAPANQIPPTSPQQVILSCSENSALGQVGVPFSAPPPTVIGGVAPFTFSLASGTVPTGLGFNTSTGQVSGTPTATGAFTLKVTDSANPPDVSGNTCSYAVNSCLLQDLGVADVFAVLALQGGQVQVQQSSGGGPVGLGAGAQLQVQGNSVLNANVFADPTATIQANGGASIVGTTTIESFSAIQDAVTAAEAFFAGLTPTQTINQQINSATTIKGNGGQNVIQVNNQINLNNGASLTISGGSSDNFVFNIAQGQNIQLQNGSSIVLSGVSPSQVVFNFLGNGANVQVQSNNQGTSNTAGIFLDPLGQINIQGGTHNSVFISGKQIQLQNAQVTIPTCGTGPTPPSPGNSCRQASPLTTLISSKNVTAYVANGLWDNPNIALSTGVQVVQIEPAIGAPSLISTANPVNSCASNSTTGETVCTANNTDVYLISGTTLKQTLASGGNYSFLHMYSGGQCYTCGVVVDEATNTAALQIGLSTANSGTGLQFLNLATSTLSAPIPAYNRTSESILWDSKRNLILSPSEGGDPHGSGTYDVYTLSASNSTQEYGYFPPANGFSAIQFDSAAEDCDTGIALGTDEDTSNLFITDLSQVKLTKGSTTPGSAPLTWTAPSAVLSLPEFNNYDATEEGITGIAIAQGTHLGIITGEFPEPVAAAGITPAQPANAIIAIKLPSTSGTGTPALQDYVVATLPNDPSGNVFSMGCDPTAVTAYVSPTSGDAIGVVGDYTPTPCTGLVKNTAGSPSYLALIDLNQLLAAPRTGAHVTSVDLFGTGILKFVPLIPQK